MRGKGLGEERKGTLNREVEVLKMIIAFV